MYVDTGIDVCFFFFFLVSFLKIGKQFHVDIIRFVLFCWYEMNNLAELKCVIVKAWFHLLFSLNP